MTWSVVYCTDQASEPAKTTVETEHELRQWVAKVEWDRGISPRSIFDKEKYINTATSQQWGTGYWWLSVTGAA